MHLIVALAREDERKIDIIVDRESIEKIEILEHEAEALAAEARQLAPAQAADVLAVHQDVADRGAVDSGDAVEQRGLARARRAHDGHELPLRHVERDSVQGAGDVLAASVVLLHRLHAQGGDA